MDDKPLDCLVIGGGPAGLTAAIYLARFHLDILVVDGGKGRAATIPCTHNHAGYPDGISGKELIAADEGAGAALWREDRRRLRVSAWSATRRAGCSRPNGARGRSGARRCCWRPASPTAARRWTRRCTTRRWRAGLIRYCPICDGYEVTDKKVGVLGSGHHGVAEAVFLRGYTADVTLIAPDKAMKVSAVDRLALDGAGIETVDGPAEAVAIAEDSITVDTAEGHFTFDSVYPALGRDMHCQLAEMVGARLSDDGCVGVDAHMRTSVEGVYAAGDLVIGLDQISNAMGQGGVAATTIRNDLAKERPLLR